MNILVTGAAGFIGFHVAKRLIENNSMQIFGIDNLNNYYDVGLKKKRIKELKKNKKFHFAKIDLINEKKINNYIKKNRIKFVIHLAAQAGVRYSIKNPKSYFNSNLLGFYNILESIKKNKVKFLIFASSSSVYGENKFMPLKENYNTDKPIQFYAATKKSNEVMAHAYSNLYKIPTICLRFFTVYGPYGRPDMSYYKFSKNIIKRKAISIFNYGNHSRDFTYIDDVKDIFFKIFEFIIKNKINKLFENKKFYNTFNVSSGKNVKLISMISEIEKNLNLKAKKKFTNKQIGDVKDTLSSNKKIKKLLKIKKFTSYREGIAKFIEWFKKFHVRN